MNDQSRAVPEPGVIHIETDGAFPSILADDGSASLNTNSVTGCCSPLSTSWLVDGKPEGVRDALADIMLSVESCGTWRELIQTTEVVFAEILNNIVEHAYSGRTNGWIKIEIVCNPSDLRVRISDGGIAMPDLEIPKAAYPDLDVPVEGLPEGGFGWLLIHTLTNDLKYERRDDRNIITFRMLPKSDHQP